MIKQAQCWLNGQPQTQLSLQDRSIQFGDGFFTTALIYKGQLFNWPAHLRRLQGSAARFQISLDEHALVATIQEAFKQFSEANSLDAVVLKVLVSRGSGGVGYRPPKNVRPQVMLYFKPAPMTPEGQPQLLSPALSLGVSSIQASMHSLAGVKTLNRLENVMAQQFLYEQPWDEAVLLNPLAQVVCSSQANIFALFNNKVVTPRLDKSGVEGTSRYQLSQQLNQWGYQFMQTDLTLADLKQADECFLTNAVRGVQPVNALWTDKTAQPQHFDTQHSFNIQQAWLNWQQKHATNVEALAVGR